MILALEKSFAQVWKLKLRQTLQSKYSVLPLFVKTPFLIKHLYSPFPSFQTSFFLDISDRSDRFKMNLVLYFHLVIKFSLFHAMGQSFSCSYCSKSNFKSLFYFCLFSFKFAHHALTNLKSQPFRDYFHKFGLNCYAFLAFFSPICQFPVQIASPSMLPKSLLHCNSLG